MSMEKDQYKQIIIDDYSNCFEQMRYYDIQINDYIKYILTFYLTVLGGIIAIYGIDSISKESITPYLKFGFLFIGIIGIAFLLIIIRNRIYFVKIARYINEIRGKAFTQLNIKDSINTYIDKSKPKYYDIFSSQIMLAHICILSNCIFFTLFLCYIISNIILLLIISIFIIIIHELLLYKYLNAKENKL